MNLRLSGLCDRMDRAGIDAALLVHHRDVLYYAGTARPASLLVLSLGGSTSPVRRKAILFVRRGLELARKEAAVADVIPMPGFSTVTESVARFGAEPGVLGIELDTTSAQLHQRIATAFPDWDVVDISPAVLHQRMVKDDDEIAATRRAAAAADAGHRACSQLAAPGLRELDLAAEVERAMRLAGHEGYQPLRDPGARGGGVMLMSGENLTVRGGHGLVVTGGGLSAATPYGTSRRVLQPGDLIVLDIGSTQEGYTADESRTFVLGQPTPAQQALFGVALEAQEAVLEAVRPGARVPHVYGVAEAVVEQGAAPFFPPGSLALPGFVGHGVGLELDEPPVLWPQEEGWLREGMVLAIEIEVNAANAQTMVKAEDTIVVLSDGPEMLTHAARTLTICGQSSVLDHRG